MVVKVQPIPSPRRLAYLWVLARPRPRPVNKLQAFYRKYRQYILTDGLMYLVFILVLALLFVFFG